MSDQLRAPGDALYTCELCGRINPVGGTRCHTCVEHGAAIAAARAAGYAAGLERARNTAVRGLLPRCLDGECCHDRERECICAAIEALIASSTTPKEPK